MLPTRWVNGKLEEAGHSPIESIETGFHTGIPLAQLITVRLESLGRSKIHSSFLLQALTDEKVKVKKMASVAAIQLDNLQQCVAVTFADSCMDPTVPTRTWSNG